MSRFREEIGEQPQVLRRLLAESGPTANEIGQRIRAAAPHALVIAARGSSDNAARYANYLFGVRNRLVTALAAPSLFTHYGRPPIVDGCCVMGISQSGASPDVVAVIDEARRQRCVTVAITNDPASPLAQAAELVLPLAAGPELSVPASKTYTATLLALAMISHGIDPDAEFVDGMGRVPDAASLALEREPEMSDHAALLNGPRAVVLGRGFNFSTAEEIALKLTETSYVLARSWSLADFAHGPAALLEPSLPVVLVDGGGAVAADLASMHTRLAEKGCRLVELRDASGLTEALTPITLGVLGQLLAYQVARQRGIDPDHPRTLSKITRTW